MHASDKTTKKWIAGFRFRLVMDKEGLFVSDVVEETDCGAMVTHHASSPYICIKMIGKLHIARTLEAFFELVIEKCQFAVSEPRDTTRGRGRKCACGRHARLLHQPHAWSWRSWRRHWQKRVLLGVVMLFLVVFTWSLLVRFQASKCCGKGASKDPTKKAKTD
jgi:hypothetical protein